MLSAAVLLLASCSKDTDFSNDGKYVDISAENQIRQAYKTAFNTYFGAPAANENWGFGASITRGITRGISDPAVAEATQPYSETWVANYLTTAKEPSSENVADNYDNSRYETNYGEGGPNDIDWSNADQVKDRNYFFGDDGNSDSWETRVAWALENHPTWINKVDDETFVLNFKITDTWNGAISVVASEGNQTPGCERTVVVTGTWNLTEDQRVGSKGRIIVADGGKIVIAEGKKLNSVNEAQIVVLPGGEISGKGGIEFSNGTDEALQSYNGGTINVGRFNNNGGNFFNYGTLKADLMDGGAGNSRYYNHALISIKATGSSANIRIYNGCQFYCEGFARIRNYEGKMGSALIVGGQLMFSSSEDGTYEATYVGLQAGALVQCGSLYNNGTSWAGPTQGGYAVLSMGQIDYLNWEQDAPQNGGYFANNIYVQADNWTNAPGGNGMGGEAADAKFANVKNAAGNGNVTVVDKGDYEVIPADEDFVLGEAGCTPGFKITEPNVLPSLRVMGEDLSATEASDFDFNDVVIEVYYKDANTVDITLFAAGGTLPLRICENDDWEVHKLFGVDGKCMVNTGKNYHTAHSPYSQKEILDPVYLTYTGYHGWSEDFDEFKVQVRDQIKLEVYKTYVNQDGDEVSDWFELTAPAGEAASKIAVPTWYTHNGWYKDDDENYTYRLRWAWEKQKVNANTLMNEVWGTGSEEQTEE